MNVRWSIRAVDRMTQIALHIAIERPDAAARWVERVLALVDGLAEQPLRGRRVPESKNPGVRELLFGEYRIFYRVTSGEVEIVNVRHGRRRFDPGDLAEPRPIYTSRLRSPDRTPGTAHAASSVNAATEPRMIHIRVAG